MRKHRLHLQRAAVFTAVLATLPYLLLKLLWLTGSKIGTTDRPGQDEPSSTRFVAGNSITTLRVRAVGRRDGGPGHRARARPVGLADFAAARRPPWPSSLAGAAGLLPFGGAFRRGPHVRRVELVDTEPAWMGRMMCPDPRLP